MKFFIKLLLFFVLLFNFNTAFASNASYPEATPEEKAIVGKYATEYAEQLAKKIDFNKFRHVDWLMQYAFTLHKDGTVERFRPLPLNTPHEGTEINDYFESIILNNPPPPLPEGTNRENLLFEIAIFKDSYDSIEANYYYYSNKISILIIKSTLRHKIHAFLFYR